MNEENINYSSVVIVGAQYYSAEELDEVLQMHRENKVSFFALLVTNPQAVSSVSVYNSLCEKYQWDFNVNVILGDKYGVNFFITDNYIKKYRSPVAIHITKQINVSYALAHTLFSIANTKHSVVIYTKEAEKFARKNPNVEVQSQHLNSILSIVRILDK